MTKKRISSLTRNTKETQISLSLNLDGKGKCSTTTGIAFFDHMLELFSRHGLFDLQVKACGDVQVDYHHTIEDVGIVLGQAVKEALGDKRGIRRYGFFILPMDEILVRVALDLSGRSFLRYEVKLQDCFVRDFNTKLIKEFFQAFANSVGANLHIKLEYGEEPHHIAEAIFKAFAKTLDWATQIDLRQASSLPSTKEKLD
jgi:imidazoleglycerol-phosphate dehydratase